MAAAAVAPVPQLEDVAGRRPGRGDHDVVALRLPVQHLDHLAFAHHLAGMVAVGVGAHDLGPVLLRLGDPFAVARERHPGALPGGEQRLQGEAGVRHHR